MGNFFNLLPFKCHEIRIWMRTTPQFDSHVYAKIYLPYVYTYCIPLPNKSDPLGNICNFLHLLDHTLVCLHMRPPFRNDHSDHSALCYTILHFLSSHFRIPLQEIMLTVEIVISVQQKNSPSGTPMGMAQSVPFSEVSHLVKMTIINRYWEH